MGGITRGQRVGRYELVRVLGEGGMGTVWLAHPRDAPEQLFAVKTVSEELASDSRVCAMFVKEATLAAAIDHPNVVRLYDVGLHDLIPFFVMEWIDGTSLREVARHVTETREPAPAGVVLRIASDLCGGLHAAHELRSEDGQPLGLVHRDVSPHNVLVTREGVPKLIDFGVAKARDLLTGVEHSVYGGVKGKVRYMAPEQAREREIDRRADLFSVGAIIYQLLTGRAPFEGPTDFAVISSLLSSNPVFIPETLPEPVQRLLRRALARRPDGRFADAAEMQRAVEAAIVALGEPAAHADVARYLAQLTNEPLASADHGDTVIGMHLFGSHPPPPLAFEASAEAAAPAARRAPTAPLDPTLAQRRRAHRSDASPWRFVLLAGGFVGLLGVGAALLAKEGGPVHARRSSARQPSLAAPPAALTPEPEPATSLVLSEPAALMPIIDIGDLDEPAPDDAEPEPAPRRAPPAKAAASPAPPAQRKAPPRRPAATPGEKRSAPASDDLAGPIKVWK